MGIEAETADNSRDLYHILGLRAYFLLTRDLNGNEVLDFDFRARTRLGEASPQIAWEFNNRTLQNELPCDTPFNYGPYIYSSEWNGRYTRAQQ